RVAAGQDQDAGPELELAGAAGREGHADHGIEGRAGQALGEPERVELQALEVGDQAGEALVVAQPLGTQAEADADLHRSLPLSPPAARRSGFGWGGQPGWNCS